MQTLVTGATGLLGRHLVDILLQAGVAVRAFVRPGSDTHYLESKNVRLFFGAAGEREALRAAVKGMDKIFHVAGYLTVDSPFGADAGTDDEWQQYKAVNVDFTEDMLNAALEENAGRFLFVSSSSVYSSDAVVPTPEDAPLIPFSIYGRSKLMAEEKVREYQALGLDTTIIRPPIIYGPGDRYFTPLALRLARLPILPLVNGGNNLMDLVCVLDVARLMWGAACSETAVGQVYNAGPGVPTTLSDLVQAFKRLRGGGPLIMPVLPSVAEHTSWLSRLIVKPFLPEITSALTPEGIKLMSRDHHLDMSRAERELDYQPQFDLDRGLALTLRSDQ